MKPPFRVVRTDFGLRFRLEVSVQGLPQPGLESLPSTSSLFHSPNFSLPRSALPAVVTIHDLSVLTLPEFHPAARIRELADEIPRAVAQARVVVTDSEFVRTELIERLEVDPDKVRTVALGVDPVFLGQSPESPPLGLASRGYCLYVGTVEPRKNLDLLLDVYEGLPGETRSRYPRTDRRRV